LKFFNEELPGTTPHAERVPYPEFGRIQLVDNGGYGNYNGLAFKLTKRYSSGLTYLFGYTWSKTMDTGSAIRTHDGDTLFPQNSYCRSCEYALSSFHVGHRYTGSILYDIPVGKGRGLNVDNGVLNAIVGGWQVGSIIAVQTGFPYTITTGIDQSNTGAGFDRPQATGQDPKLSSRAPARWFNTDAFVRQTFGTFGNVGRNTMIGPSIFQWDFSSLKNFNFTEQHYLQFRFEAFNAANHPNWSNPNSNRNSAAFGTIAGTRGNMRQLQLALKFVF
jgi:hypothetical protein